MLKARLRTKLRESREESFAELWHEACLKKQTTGRAHESNSEFLGKQKFDQLVLYIRGFNSEFLGRFSDTVLAKLLDLGTVHSCHEQDIVTLQAQRSTSLFVIVSGSVGLFHKKADKDKKGEPGPGFAASRTLGSEGYSTTADQAAGDLSSEDESPEEVKTAKSGYLHMLDWRLYPESHANRFKRFFCVLSKGVFSWYESKDSVRIVGSEDVPSASHCMVLAPGTVGYKKTSVLVRDSELPSLGQSFELHYVIHGSMYPRRTVFMAKDFDATLSWVKALQSWMEIPAGEANLNPVARPHVKPPVSPASRSPAPAFAVRARRPSVAPRPVQTPKKDGAATASDRGSADESLDSEGVRSSSPASAKWDSLKQNVRSRKWQRRQAVTMGLSPLEELHSPSLVLSPAPTLSPTPAGLPRQSTQRKHAGSSRVLVAQLHHAGVSGGAVASTGGGEGLDVAASLASLQRDDTGLALVEGLSSAESDLDRQGTDLGGSGELGRSGHGLERSGTEPAASLMTLPRRRGSIVREMGQSDGEELVRRPRVRRSSLTRFSSENSMRELETTASARNLLGLPGASDRTVVKGMNVAPWHKARHSSAAEAWAIVTDVFGDPICVLNAGDSFGEGSMLVDKRRMSSAIALSEVRLLEISKTALQQSNLYDVVLHGQVWASPIVTTFLRPYPLMRQESQISVILNVVEESSFFQQIPLEARRGLLEGCHLRVTSHGEQVLGSYVPPFTMRSPPPLYLILHGRVEVHQGPRVLNEAIAGLRTSSVQDMQSFFPRQGQVLLAEEAWGGPLVWTDLRSLQVHKIQDQIPLEKDPNKAHRMRQQVWALQEAFTYTLVATEATTYLRIDPHDWVPVLSGVRDVVFRATTLHQILKKPPRERAPQQARLMASLVQGYTAFQQLPMSLVLNLSYHMEFVDARFALCSAANEASETMVNGSTGRLLMVQGQKSPGVFLVMKGKVDVYKQHSGDTTPFKDAAIGSFVAREEIDLFFGEPQQTLAQGAWFGEDDLRFGAEARTSVIASEDSKILMIPAPEFMKEIKNTGLTAQPTLDDKAQRILAKDVQRRTKEEQELLGISLAKLAWLGELDPAVRRRLAEVVPIRKAKRGETLAKQGAFSDMLMFIIAGSVSLHHVGVGIDELGHVAEGFDPITPMSEEHSWVYAPLTAKCGKCFAVVAAGGSLGEVGFAHGSERGSSVLAREDTEYFCLEKDALGYELMYLIRVQLQNKQGIPPGIKKVPGTRTEYDLVKLVAFLREHPFFRACTDKTACQVAQLIELFRFEEGQVIQNDRETDKLLHIVDGGRVRLQKISDAGKALTAARQRSKVKETRSAKHQVSRRAMLQELKGLAHQGETQKTVSPTTVSEAKQAKALLGNADSSDGGTAEASEPTRIKPKEARRLTALEKSDSHKVLLKVFNGSPLGAARRLSMESVLSDEGASVAGSRSGSPQPSRTSSAAKSPLAAAMSPLAAASRRASAFSRAPSAAGDLSRLSSAASGSSSHSQKRAALLDWGKHFVVGAAIADTKAQILRMSYSRWLHLQKVSGTLEKMDAANFFAGMKSFGGWSKKELAHLADKVKVLHFARESKVVARGQEPQALLFLRCGRCTIRQNVPPTYHGPGGHQMVEDDKLYRVQKRRHGEDKDYVSRITAGKLFRCPACQEQAKPKGKAKSHHAKTSESPDKDPSAVCSVCHGTRAIRPAAMSRAPASKTGTEVGVGRTVGTVLPKNLINCALERMDAPLEHEVVATEDCEVFSVDIEALMDLCEAKPKLLTALTDESQRVAEWHAQKKQDNIGTRTAIHDDVVHFKTPKVKDQIPGEQPNTEMLQRLYPQHDYVEIVVPRGIGSLSKSGKKGALLIGNWKSETQMPNHRIDGKTKLLMHAAHGPAGASQDMSMTSLERQSSVASDEEDPYMASGDSDELDDFFVTSGAGLAAEERNRKVWDDDDVKQTSLAITVDPQGLKRSSSVIPTFEHSQEVHREPAPRSKSSLDILYEKEAAHLFNVHFEVMAGASSPQLKDRWKRSSYRRRAGAKPRALSSSPFAMDHIHTLQTLHAQREPSRAPLALFNSPSKQGQAAPALPGALIEDDPNDYAAERPHGHSGAVPTQKREGRHSLRLQDKGRGQKTTKSPRSQQERAAKPLEYADSSELAGWKNQHDDGEISRMPPIPVLSGTQAVFTEQQRQEMGTRESRLSRQSQSRLSRPSRRGRRGDTLESSVVPVRSLTLEVTLGSRV